jgi:hypothetical protein
VSLFYLKRYADAIQDFEITNQKAGKNAFDQTQLSNTFKSAITDKTDLSDIGLTSINSYESTYNILICQLLMNKKEDCVKSLSLLFQQLPPKYQKSYKALNDKISGFFKTGSLSESIYFFSATDQPRLCDLFGEVKLGNVTVRISFSMPFLRPPNMIPSVDELSIQSEFSLKQIDAPMPEAPWVRKCKHQV